MLQNQRLKKIQHPQAHYGTTDELIKDQDLVSRREEDGP
jgi:hypothetical protein